ncbi:MAG: hypothetical protein K2X47_20280, partial [Bdellovibrionales bacterium]|nr:hypothetical protein [Bdellovibrionales bacterium]
MESYSARQLSHQRIQSSSAVSLCLIAMLGLSACGSSSSSTPSKNVTFTERPDDESCLFEADSGDKVSLPQNSSKESFFFGKTIDSAKIKGVYRASGKSTVSQMNAQGIEVLGVTRAKPDKCVRYSFLKTPPYEMQNLWKRIENQVNGGGEGDAQIAGVFFPSGNKTGGVLFKRPTVMVGIDANRYVVVHEYMHFLYDSELAGQPGYMTMQDTVGELDRLNKDLGREVF